jgi:hypothetical protein
VSWSPNKTHDRQAIQDLHFEPGDLLIFDRAYLDYVWLYQLHQDGVWFVTRLKSNSCYEVIQDQTASGPVLADQVIRLSSPQGQACYPELLRRVHYRDPETGKEYVFLTNRLDLSALEVAELYRRRWQTNLDCFDRLPAADVGQVQDQGRLGTSGTHPLGPNHAPGTHGLGGVAWSSSTRQPTALAIQLACRTAVIFC